MKILVAGGDGYVGWPLSLKLAKTRNKDEIIIIDNQLKRSLIEEHGLQSVIPILPIEERIIAARKFGIKNLSYANIDVASPKIDQYISDQKPEVIYHLAQIPSAPYSMENVENTVKTIKNNEIGNARIAWAVRKYCPDCHIIKLGSFGEYSAEELDIAEGYFTPEYNGKSSTVPIPYPRQADDVYHITKINDSNILSMACNNWKLRVTEIMQATIFGIGTEDTLVDPKLMTRFDCDPSFGTVLNRFIAQALCDSALTIYGTGKQRTGLMYLQDAINSLASLLTELPDKGEHRIINHLSESDFCINQIADAVINAATMKGIKVIKKYGHNPRSEFVEIKKKYNIESSFSRPVTPIKKAIEDIFEVVSKYKDRISEESIKAADPW